MSRSKHDLDNHTFERTAIRILLAVSTERQVRDGQSAFSLALSRHRVTDSLTVPGVCSPRRIPFFPRRIRRRSGTSAAGIHQAPRGTGVFDEIRRRYMQMASEPFH